jgi:Zinc knuckle
MESQVDFAIYHLFQAFLQFLHTFEQIYFQPQEQTNLIDLEIGDDDDRWTDDSQFNPNINMLNNNENNQWDNMSNEYYSQDGNDSGYCSFGEEIPVIQQIPGYKSVNDYLRENENIDKQRYFLMFNEINHNDMRHYYVQGLNKGLCWNCSQEHTHICCAACQRFTSSCECQYICGYTRPSGQKNKRGEYTQVTKCKYYTDNIDDVVHDCQGMIKEEHVILFIDETETKRFNQNNILRVKHCYRCKKDGHFSHECTDFRCYKCNEKGHFARDCLLSYSDIYSVFSH